MGCDVPVEISKCSFLFRAGKGIFFPPILIREDEKNEVTNLTVLQAPTVPGYQLFGLPGGIPVIKPLGSTDAPNSLLGLENINLSAQNMSVSVQKGKLQLCDSLLSCDI